MRSVIKRNRILTGEQADAARATSAPIRAAGHGTRSVRVVELDDGASAIEFTCGCGEVTVLEVEFEAKGGSARGDAR